MIINKLFFQYQVISCRTNPHDDLSSRRNFADNEGRGQIVKW